MDWFKKHTDAVMIIAAMLGGMIWMNGQFNELKTEMAVIKTVLIMKGIMPEALSCNEDK